MKVVFRRLLEVLFFFSVTLLSFYTIFKDQDLSLIWTEISTMSMKYLCFICCLALCYVVAESVMIYIFLHPIDKECKFHHCINYSFIGFFYSSITPSASGGQPMQLYYMKKDGRSFGSSFMILMSIATMNKIVLSLIGIALLIFAKPVLMENLNGYKTLFYIGFSIDIIWVVILVSLIVVTKPLKKVILNITNFFLRKRPAKMIKADEQISSFFNNYHNSFAFVRSNPLRIIFIFLISVAQRIIPLVITALVYKGLGISSPDAITIMIIQAAILVTVEMLPLPGAQGISEAMYREVFMMLIPATSIMSSMYVSRGVNFYFLLLFSSIIVGVNVALNRRRNKIHANNA